MLALLPPHAFTVHILVYVCRRRLPGMEEEGLGYREEGQKEIAAPEKGEGRKEAQRKEERELLLVIWPDRDDLTARSLLYFVPTVRSKLRKGGGRIEGYSKQEGKGDDCNDLPLFLFSPPPPFSSFTSWIHVGRHCSR